MKIRDTGLALSAIVRLLNRIDITADENKIAQDTQDTIAKE
jgi:hypothetical protein